MNKKESPEIIINEIPLYRACKNLAYGGERITIGSLHTMDKCSSSDIEILLRKRAISRVIGPPLAELPGWITRAAKLKKLGIITVSQFLGVESDVLAEHLKRTPATIVLWKAEAQRWLLSPPKRGG